MNDQTCGAGGKMVESHFSYRTLAVFFHFLNEWSNMFGKRSSPIRALAVKIETKLLNWWSRNKYYHKINPIDLKLIQSIAYQIKTLWLCSIIGSITSVTLNNLINIVTSHKSSPYHSTQSFEHQISFFPQIHVNQELYLLFINTAMPQRLVELRDDKSFYHKDYERISCSCAGRTDNGACDVMNKSLTLASSSSHQNTQRINTQLDISLHLPQ